MSTITFPPDGTECELHHVYVSLSWHDRTSLDAAFTAATQGASQPVLALRVTAQQNGNADSKHDEVITYLNGGSLCAQWGNFLNMNTPGRGLHTYLPDNVNRSAEGQIALTLQQQPSGTSTAGIEPWTTLAHQLTSRMADCLNSAYPMESYGVTSMLRALIPGDQLSSAVGGALPHLAGHTVTARRIPYLHVQREDAEDGNMACVAIRMLGEDDDDKRVTYYKRLGTKTPAPLDEKRTVWASKGGSMTTASTYPMRIEVEATV